MRLKSVGDLQSDFDERFQIWSPSLLLRERDVSYGSVFSKRVAAMGITEVVTVSRSPWPERLCRARDWLDPPRMSRPRCDLQ
jgi:hypothetical protein